MKITEVSILLNQKPGRMRAFVGFCIGGDFTIHDAKVIVTEHNTFVAMPTRKNTFRCGNCQHSCWLDARYCSYCGADVSPPPVPDGIPLPKPFIDVCHPTTGAARDAISRPVLAAWRAECELAKIANYQTEWARYDVLESEKLRRQ